MEVIEIKNRWNEAVLYSGEHVDVKEAVEAAVKAGANLRDADLGDANLHVANLCPGAICFQRLLLTGSLLCVGAVFRGLI